MPLSRLIFVFILSNVINAFGQILKITPDTLNFGNVYFTRGDTVFGRSVDTLSFDIIFESSNPFSFNIRWSLYVSDVSWIKLSTYSGSTPRNSFSRIGVVVKRDIAGPGNHVGWIGVSTDIGGRSVYVNLANPKLVVSEKQLVFENRDMKKVFTISNDSNAPLYWRLKTENSWLYPNATGGSILLEIDTVVVTLQNRLASGKYIGTISVSDFYWNFGGSAVIEVTALIPNLFLSARILRFGSDSNEMSLDISNTGAGTLISWLYINDSWIKVTPDSFRTQADSTNAVAVRINRNILSPGQHQGKIYVNSTDENDSVTVMVDIPKLATNRSALDFNDNGISLGLSLTNIGAGRLNWKLSNAVSWLVLDQQEGILNAQETDELAAQVNRFGLGIGTYSGIILFTTNNTSDLIEINVSMKVASPKINHVPIIFHEEKNALEIEVNITDILGVEHVELNYRLGGESGFNTLAMVQDGDRFKATIPGGKITDRGLEYKIFARNSNGNMSVLPENGSFSVQSIVKGDGAKRSTAQPNGTSSIDYRLISFPLDISSKSPTTILEDDLKPYNIRKWRFYALASDQNYVEFSQIDSIGIGKAYWLLVKDKNRIIDTGPGKSISINKKYSIPLDPGSNFIGNPFTFPASLEDTLSDGQEVLLRTYNRGWSLPLSSKVLEPFEGYLIDNLSDTEAILYVNPERSSSGADFFSKPILSKLDALSWKIDVNAESELVRDINNILGVSPQSSDAWDKNDLPEPPFIEEFVSVRFPHPEWEMVFDNFTSDVRADVTEGGVWDFEVKTNIHDKIELGFSGIESVPPRFEVWLVDEALGTVRNLREEPRYPIAGRGIEHPKRLKLVVGKHAFVQEKFGDIQTIPETYELHQNFPNPFNPATTIRYGLPQAERVTLKIYNLLGEEVVTLMNDEFQAAGYHVAIWDGRNKLGDVVGSGVYIYRFRAGSFTSIKKMALVK